MTDVPGADFSSALRKFTEKDSESSVEKILISSNRVFLKFYGSRSNDHPSQRNFEKDWKSQGSSKNF